MNLRKAFTPKDTEEIKPNFFIQRWKGNYRQVNPVAWNGKYRWKEQVKTIFTFRTLFWIALILFIAWSYMNDVQQYKQFYEDVKGNPVLYCENVFRDGGVNSLDLIKGDDGVRINLQPNN